MANKYPFLICLLSTLLVFRSEFGLNRVFLKVLLVTSRGGGPNRLHPTSASQTSQAVFLSHSVKAAN